MSDKVRAEAPAALVQLAASLGASPERLLAAAGMTAADLTDPERPIEIASVMRIADAAAREVGDECLGLHAGRMVDFGVFGMLAYAVFNAPTVGTALRNMERYARSHFRGPRITTTVASDEARFAFVVDVADDVPRRQHAEAAAVIALRILRRLLGRDWQPRRVLFVHARPRDLAEHERILRAPIEFGQDVHVAVVFAAADLDRPVPDADRRLLPVIERHLDELLAKPHSDSAWLDDVRAAIAASVCDGQPKIGAIARRFGMSVRTFQRRLDEHRVVFKDLVEGVRRDLSLRYVADGRTSLTDVAFLVGYSELSAFGRAFRRWTGSTPTEMRRHLATAPESRT